MDLEKGIEWEIDNVMNAPKWWLHNISNIIYALLLAEKICFGFLNTYSLLFKMAVRLKLISWEVYVCTCSLLYPSPRIQFSIMSLIQFGGNVTEDAWFKVGVREYSYLTSWARTVQFRVCVTRHRPCHVCVCVSFHPRGNWGVPQRNASWSTHQAPATDYSIVASRYRCS